MHPEDLFVLGIPALLFAFFVLFLLEMRRKKGSERQRKEELSVLIDSFNEIIKKLRAQEEELKHLKALAEQRADDATSYSENILESVPSGVVSLDRDLKITKINRAASEILKISREEAIGMPFEKVFGSPLKELISKKQIIRRQECLYTNPSGQEIWLGLSMNELRDASRQPIGFIIVFSDITEVKALERQVRLKEHLTSLGELSMGIAHELKNPMGVIMGYIKILLKKWPESIELRTIQKEVQLMDRIINDFMSFARPVHVDLQEVDMNVLLEEAIRPLLIGKNGIRPIIECELERLKTDSTLLRQSIVNLVKNAIEAMPKGGTLRVTAKKQGNKGVIEVSDTGYGIPEEIRQRVFMPFFTKKESGTGLGLAIVQRNITLLNGTVDFVSSVDGTTFRIELPL